MARVTGVTSSSKENHVTSTSRRVLAPTRPSDRRPRLSHRLRLLAGAAAVVTLATACGTTGGEDTADAAPLTGIDELYEGTFSAPPETAPPVPEGQSLWIVNCGEVATACSTTAAGATEAAEAIGWDARLCDGELNAGGAWARCIRQAIAAEADAILLVAIDCGAIAQPLHEAEAAGILTVSSLGYDCDDPEIGEESLFTASVIPSEEHPTTAEYTVALGEARADWVRAVGGDDAEVIEVDFQGVLAGVYAHQGFTEGMSDCADCTIHSAPVTNQSIGTLRQTLESAILQNPEANFVTVTNDALVLLGSSQAVAGSPRRGEISLIGGEGAPPVLDLMREGLGVNAVLAQSMTWFGYAGIDTIIRVLNDEEAVPAGLGFQLIDTQRGLPESGAYEPPVDFKAAYRAAWQVAG